ncbi:MAG: hypothetical protein U0T73_06055 [Chitinophagales bacterium]
MGASLLYFFKFIALATSTATFGFFVGEWSDQDDDRLAGKTNTVSSHPEFPKGLFMILICSSIIYFAAVALKHSEQVVLYCALLTSLLLYSVPPFRLKRFFKWAILLDSLYSGSLFVVIVLLSNNCITGIWALLCFVLFLLKGCRNILVHLHTDTRDQSIQQHRLLGNYQKAVHFLAAAESVLLVTISYQLLSPAGALITGFLILATATSKYFFSKKEDELPWIDTSRLNLFYETLWPFLFIFHLILLDVSNIVYLILQVLLFDENQRWIRAVFNKIKIR